MIPPRVHIQHVVRWDPDKISEKTQTVAPRVAGLNVLHRGYLPVRRPVRESLNGVLGRGAKGQGGVQETQRGVLWTPIPRRLA